jgi:hypothetical protein
MLSSSPEEADITQVPGIIKGASMIWDMLLITSKFSKSSSITPHRKIPGQSVHHSFRYGDQCPLIGCNVRAFTFRNLRSKVFNLLFKLNKTITCFSQLVSISGMSLVVMVIWFTQWTWWKRTRKCRGKVYCPDNIKRQFHS